MGGTITQSATKLNNSSGCHESFYISKVNQTVRIPSGDQFEFFAGELVNVECSQKVLSLASSHLASTHDRDSSTKRILSVCSQTQTFVQSDNGRIPPLVTRSGFSRGHRLHSLSSNLPMGLLPPYHLSLNGRYSGPHGT